MPNQMMASQQPYQQQYQNTSKENTSAAYQKMQQAREESANEWELIETYVGKNSDRLASGFSWCTAFFGIFYMVYRKMYLFAATS